nr:RNase LS family HEPN domain-containing protein [Clostridium paridis]
MLISKVDVEDAMEKFCKTKSGAYTIHPPIEINKGIGQTRYKIEFEDSTLEIDFYFRKDNKTTILPIGDEENKRRGFELADYIVNELDYTEIKSDTIVIKTTKSIFDELVKYLSGIKGVKVVKNYDDEIKNLYQFISEIGDKMTLTFFYSSDKILFQGYLLKLYSEMKCFLNPLGAGIENIDIQEDIQEDIIESILRKSVPKAYDKLDSQLKDYLYDSFVQVKSKTECRDFSVWAFPALKGLEAFIKQILLKNGTVINDLNGFAIKIVGKRTPIFIDGKLGCKILNPVVVLKDVAYKNPLEETYDFFAKNRHVLFHTKQILPATKKLENSSDAEVIIYKVCEFFEKYYELIV